MKEIKRATRKLLFELGVPASSKGFTYAVDILCDSVVNQKPIIYKDKVYDRWAVIFEDTSYNVERVNQKPIIYKDKVYDRWAVIFEDTSYNVERALRYIKDECLNQYNELFRSIFGNTTNIGTYDFLEMLRFYLIDEVDFS